MLSNNIMVKNRAGDLVPIDITQIQKKTIMATEGIAGVDRMELESRLQIQFFSGITTDEIQQTIIKTAAEMIDVDTPNYTYVAARAFLSNIYHIVGRLFKGDKSGPYSHSLEAYLDYGFSEGRINGFYKNGYDLKELNEYIKPERDFLFTYLGIKTMHDRYLLKNKENVLFELPQHMFMAVSMYLALKEKDKTYWAKKFYDLISTFEVMPATPTLSNARKNRPQLSSCFQGVTDDNIESIFDSYKDMALISKFGGGIGWDWSYVRSNNSEIDGYKGASNGLVSWHKIMNDVAVSVDQLGCVASNSYVKIKAKGGVETIPITEVKVGDKILSYNGQTNEVEFAKVTETVRVEVKTKDQVKLTTEDGVYIVTSAWHPFPVFDHRQGVIKYIRSDKVKVGDITVGDNEMFKKVTLIEKGEAVAYDENFADLSVEGNENYFCSTDVSSDNISFNLIHNTRRGAIASYIEVWHMDINDFIDLRKNSGEERLRAHDIFPALWIPDLFMKRVEADEHWTLFDPFEVRELHTLYGEDFEKRYKELEENENVRKEKISAKGLWKKILLNYYETGTPFLAFKDTANLRNQNAHSGEIMASNLCFTGETLVAVSDYLMGVKIKDLAEFSQGKKKFEVFSAKENGIKWENQIKTAVAFKTGTKKIITVTLSNGSSFRCTPNHKLALADGGYIEAENSIGRELQAVPNEIDLLSNDNTSKIIVTGIVDNNETEDVYDLTVDDNHNFYILPQKGEEVNEGILVHNCTEIFQNTSSNKYEVRFEFEDGNSKAADELDIVHYEISQNETAKKYAKQVSTNDVLVWKSEQGTIERKRVVFCDRVLKEYGDVLVCNLASVNLAKVNTKEHFEKAIPIAVRMLDNVIDLNFYPIKQAMLTNVKNRAIGLGLMGEAQMLAEAGVAFGTQEHFDLLDKVMANFSYEVINASADLAKERGSYPQFENSFWSQGILPIHTANKKVKELLNDKSDKADWAYLSKKVQEGMRNGYLMAIAPTSTISILTGTTQGIEPVYRRKWLENNISGSIAATAPGISLENWNFYIPAYDLDQTSLVKAAAVRQQYIDQGQSLNIFMSIPKASGQYLDTIYKLAWKLGVKSTYYLRSESPDLQANKSVDRSIECSNCQ